MPVAAVDFLANYCEFAPIHAEDSALVEAHLARAERRFGDSIPTELRDDLVMLTAACSLAKSPAGRAARLCNKDGKSMWDDELMARKKAHAFAYQRVGPA